MNLNRIQSNGKISLKCYLKAVKNGFLSYNEDITYYCKERDMVVIGTEGLSSTGKTCYYLDDTGRKRGFRCKDGWKKLKLNKQVKPKPKIQPRFPIMTKKNKMRVRR